MSLPSRDNRPVWLLDFDGVLNVATERGDESVWQDWNYHWLNPDKDSHTGMPWMLWSSTVSRAVREVHESGIRVVWLTTWLDMTSDIPKVIHDIPEGLEYWSPKSVLEAGFELSPKRDYGQGWKVDCAEFLVPDNVPLLWTDDALRRLLKKQDREKLTSRTADTLLISPSPSKGLTRAHLKKIKDWSNRALTRV